LFAQTVTWGQRAKAGVDAKSWLSKGATGVAVCMLVDLAMKFGTNGFPAK
jgi:hypothetical protein